MAEDQPVEKPTYMADIRYFFEKEDIDHMRARGKDLGTYAGVKKHKLAIMGVTAPPNATMPKEKARHWSQARWQTFKNWIATGCPQGTVVPSARVAGLAMAAKPTRLRKNVTKLSDAEITNLTNAFRGIMAKSTDDPLGYYQIASLHGLPQAFCMHHMDQFNPWHRAYMKMFEDALRSIKGCEDVTLPYWDISTPIPGLLKKPPFDSYVVPFALGNYPANYQTTRYDQSKIDGLLKYYNVLGNLDKALGQSRWGASGVSGFQNFSIKGHDGGHNSIGDTMADQDIASYDPIFWFFHCNLDRHWLSWQTNAHATTLQGFESTLDNTDWLTSPFNGLDGIDNVTADQTIDFEGIGYDYLMTTTGARMAAFENKVGSMAADRAFTIRRSNEISVMVKDIDRLNIPGSFVVTLLADGEPVSNVPFFQPKKPRDCAGCRKQGLVSVTFEVEQDKVLDKKLSVAIDVPHLKELGGTNFALSDVGNPTINARFLLEDA